MDDHTSDTVTIQLTKGYSCIVDIEDADLTLLNCQAWVSSNSAHVVYAITNIPSSDSTTGFKSKKLHRIIAERALGIPITSEELVDHINGNTLDNRRSNLRICGHSGSTKNRGTFKTNKLQMKGVYQRSAGKYRAQIQVDGKKIMLGQYDTAEEAYQAYCEAAVKYHGEFARLK
jgi:hypothetical protein